MIILLRRFRSLLFRLACRTSLSDVFIYNAYFFANHLKRANLHNPVTFNDYILNRMAYDRRKDYSGLADKIRVREKLETLGLGKYLVPIYGVYKSFDDIDLSSLPKSFVLKASHDSGSTNIVLDKKNCDLAKIRHSIESALERDYYSVVREWHYKHIPRKIILEKFLTSRMHSKLVDYKFYCIHGNVEFIHVVCQESNSSVVYNPEWKQLPFMYKHRKELQLLEKPSKLDEMVGLSSELCKGFNFIRIDLYEIDGKVYFGEITLNPNYGMGKFYPKKYDKFYGDRIRAGGTYQSNPL